MMNEDAFSRLVAEEVKNKASDTQKEYLNLPENWDRWQTALVALIDNLDEQLADLQESEDTQRERYEALGKDGLKLLAEMLADFEYKKKRIIRFRHHVERKLEAVRRMVDGQSEVIEERARLVEFLRSAIERHRGLTVQVGMEPTSIDEALWQALTGAWAFDDIDLSSFDDED